MKDNSNKKIAALIVLIVILIIAIAAVIFLLLSNILNNSGGSPSDLSSDIETSSDGSDNENETETVALVENPVDFASLQADNVDLYAWITVPNTAVDYVVAQAGDDNNDLFYLTHNMYGDYEFSGTIYSEKQNAKDFSDPVTVLYGHNMADGTMFAGLKNFRDETFFDEQKYFYIYTPGHILTYEIFAAYTYDNRHILNTFDFSDENVFAEYLDYATDASKNGGYVREDTEVTVNDTIVILSTCVNSGADRYLVHGVLVKDERTY